MTYTILIALIAGILSGKFILPREMVSNLDSISSFALNLLILSVGIDLGSNREIFYNLKKMGLRVLLIPLSIIAGSLIGGVISGLIYNMPLNLGLAISSGFGWYSLSGVMLKNIAGPKAGTIAFLTNVFRELIAVIAIPIIADKLNHLSAIAPAGATSMDSTLPIISEATDKETAVISFINGALLSALVPVLVPLIYGLNK
ncbi:lysine exporter LysO family protein [Fonticella tunisiensis]|uniref:Lysine exporter LysO-like protein n=1 Tax=Fonticella tunisiensis TaxID=1096341 RepID=A0A4R7KP17_9CLOT|nr:lysine exporter LysO family protein [Fonticella tunisiensis]TDT58450.1 lysine exporter LysO-like protein [Fonticella tunisiensis]